MRALGEGAARNESLLAQLLSYNRGVHLALARSRPPLGYSVCSGHQVCVRPLRHISGLKFAPFSASAADELDFPLIVCTRDVSTLPNFTFFPYAIKKNFPQINI